MIKEEIKRETKKYLEINENGNATHSNLWDAAKAALRGIFIAVNTYIKKKERSQINNLTLHLKLLEKEQTKHKASRKKEITKIRAEIKETENRNTIENIDENNSWFF